MYTSSKSREKEKKQHGNPHHIELLEFRILQIQHACKTEIHELIKSEICLIDSFHSAKGIFK